MKKIVLFGDFNVQIDENHMKSSWENYYLTNLVKQPRCYKNPTDPTCINLFLSNVHRVFKA